MIRNDKSASHHGSPVGISHTRRKAFGAGIAQRTGGKAYRVRTWQKQVEAFEDIREDMSNSYTITYYPQPNPNEGFRTIKVEILSDPGKKYRIRSRPGYRPSRSF